MKVADESGPRHQQITSHLRHQILTGVFQPGTALPTLHQLAEQYETSYFTVQTALTPLAEEGLVERKRRVGTIVRYNARVLTKVGIYCGSGMLNDTEYGFYRELVHQLQQLLLERRIQTEVFIDTRQVTQTLEPLPTLKEATESHQVQGLLVVLCNQDSLRWLRELPIPGSFSTSAVMDSRVSFDNQQMIRDSVQALHAQGCRKIGMITSLRRPQVDKPMSPEAVIHHAFSSSMAELDLEIRESWQCLPDTYPARLEAYGYTQFGALWAQDERPDGIIVYPDMVARGVMTAVLEQAVAVPGSLKMVFHRNTGVDWICPLKVDWAISDVAQMAEAMVEQLLSKKAGETVSEQVLPYRFLSNDHSGSVDGGSL